MTMRASDRLPNEILIEVASSLDMADLLSISQTHRSWRQVLTLAPRLWTKLVVKSKVKRPSHHQLINLFEHVLMVAERSHHALERVVLRVHSSVHWARQMHHILRLSAATLKHIELYAPNQPFMYTQLYRFCPLLRKLVFLNDEEVSIPVSPIAAQMLPVKELPPILQREAEPFHLEEFHAGDVDVPQMDKHLDQIRVLTRFNLFRWHVKAGAIKLKDERLASSIAEHLEHWQYPQDDQQHETSENPPAYRPLIVRLPRLKSLLNLELEPHSIQLRFACPNLLEMAVSLYDGAYDTAEELAETLRSTTRLQSLTFVDCDLFVDGDLITVLHHLPDLRYLDLAKSHCQGFAGELLLPYAKPNSSGVSELVWPFPKLHTLFVSGVRLDIAKLPRSLWIRELVRMGFGLLQATQIVSDQISDFILDEDPASPLFHLDHWFLSNHQSLTSDMDQDSRLEDLACYTRLQELVVHVKRPIPGAMVRLLENVTERLTPKLIS